MRGAAAVWAKRAPGRGTADRWIRKSAAAKSTTTTMPTTQSTAFSPVVNGAAGVSRR